jgi:cytochrome P450
MQLGELKTIKLPRVVFALADQDREEFYKKLNEAGSVFLIEEDRHWLINSIDLVTKLFQDPNLSSNRLSVKNLLNDHADKFSIDFFYENWLMYMDNSEHTLWRNKFICHFPKKDSQQSQIYEVAPSLFSRRVDFDICDALIKPYVIHSLAQIAGINDSSLASAHDLLKPIFQVLHGRGQKSINYEKKIHDGLNSWPTFIQMLLTEQKLTKNGFLSKLSEEEDQLKGIATGLLPFIDVIDAIVTLCCRVLINYHAINSESNIKLEKGKLIDLIRLYSPFQVCNREVIGLVKDLPTIDFRINDKVSLLIGAANRNPAKSPDITTNIDQTLRNLSFGIGNHSCPGRNWSIAIICDFYDLLTNHLIARKKTFKVNNFTYQESFGFMGIDSIHIQFDNK